MFEKTERKRRVVLFKWHLTSSVTLIDPLCFASTKSRTKSDSLQSFSVSLNTLLLRETSRRRFLMIPNRKALPKLLEQKGELA